jgi:hypothetical protein
MNHEMMVLWSDNDKRFKEITKNWEPENIWIDRKDTDRKASVVITAPYLPFAAVGELSALHPEMTFTASCYFDYEGWEREYLYEFKAGDGKFVRVEANYFWPVLKGINEEQDSVTGSMELPGKGTVNRLKEKITRVFSRIDVTTGEEEGMDIDFYDGEVSVTAEDGGLKMKATKIGSHITAVKLHKRTASIVWEETYPNDYDIPM